MRAGSGSTLRRILVLHGGALGDFVLTLRVVAAIRGGAPCADVDVAARSPLAAWAAERGAFKRGIALDGLPLHGLYAQGPLSPDLERALAGYDLVVSFLGHDRAAHSQRLRAITGGGCICIDPAANADTLRSRRHITDQWLDALAAAGLSLPPAAGAWLPCGADRRHSARERLRAALDDPRGAITLIQPGSGGREKCCPLDALEAVARALGDMGSTVAWMIGPAEREWWDAATHARLGQVAPLICEPDLGAAADLLGGADLYIGNDSGITHLAAAVDVPTIALFGPTDPNVWAPIGERVHVESFTPPSGELVARVVKWAGAVLGAIPAPGR